LALNKGPVGTTVINMSTDIDLSSLTVRPVFASWTRSIMKIDHGRAPH
jgi:hypothetical protein